jgi:hypothetical protein
MLICTSSPLSLDTSSSYCLSVARASSSVARSRWSWPNASSCAMRSCSSAGQASTRAAPLLLKLALRLLACGSLLLELLLHRGERHGLLR